MSRLSKVTGDYLNSGTITDRYQLTAVGGETGFDLSFIEGSEEVYLNGLRKSSGAANDYSVEPNRIVFNTPLVAGDTILLIGRVNSNDSVYSRGNSEKVSVVDGQLEVTFSSIQTDGIEVSVNGPLSKGCTLISPQDYTLKDASVDTIILKHSYPTGTLIEGIQHGRFAWVDPDNLVVDDGNSRSSLSNKFASIRKRGNKFSSDSPTGGLDHTISTSDAGYNKLVLTETNPVIKFLFNDVDPESVYESKLLITQGVAGMQVVWPAGIHWKNNTPPVLSTNLGYTDIFNVIMIGSSEIYIEHIGAFKA